MCICGCFLLLVATVVAQSTASYSYSGVLLASATATAAILLALGWVTGVTEEAVTPAKGCSGFTVMVTDTVNRSADIASETLPSNLLIYLGLIAVHCLSGRSSVPSSNEGWWRCCYACGRIGTILVPGTPTITTVKVVNSEQTVGYLQCYTSGSSFASV